jgi:hypothetical protein
MLKDDQLDPEKVDILIHSKQIKALIVKRITDNNVSVMRLCAALKIRYNDLRIYLNTGSVHMKPLSHYEVLKVCKALCLDIRVQVIAGNESEIDPKLKLESAREERIPAERYHDGITEKLGKITGNHAGAFRNPTGLGEHNTGGDLGGNEV